MQQKRMSYLISNESLDKLNQLVDKCNEGFEEGYVRHSDVVDWILQNSNVDVNKVRMRCLNPNKVKTHQPLVTKKDADEFIRLINQMKPYLKDEKDTKKNA